MVSNARGDRTRRKGRGGGSRGQKGRRPRFPAGRKEGDGRGSRREVRREVNHLSPDHLFFCRSTPCQFLPPNHLFRPCLPLECPLWSVVPQPGLEPGEETIHGGRRARRALWHLRNIGPLLELVVSFSPRLVRHHCREGRVFAGGLPRPGLRARHRHRWEGEIGPWGGREGERVDGKVRRSSCVLLLSLFPAYVTYLLSFCHLRHSTLTSSLLPPLPPTTRASIATAAAVPPDRKGWSRIKRRAVLARGHGYGLAHSPSVFVRACMRYVCVGSGGESENV